MFIVWIVFHVMVCVALILVVLMQASKGGGLAGSAFGGGDIGGAVFGGRGAASFLSKATSILAVLFMINSVGLAYMSSQRRSGIDTESTGDSIVTQRARDELSQQMQQQQADSLARSQQESPVSPLDTLGSGLEPTPSGDTSGQ